MQPSRRPAPSGKRGKRPAVTSGGDGPRGLVRSAPRVPRQDCQAMRVAIVASRFNRGVVEVMLDECVKAMGELGIPADRRHFVPGALELPFASQCLAMEEDDAGEPLLDGLIALGCVIRGETHHFEVVANTSAAGLMQVQLEASLPVANGVLTVDTEAQALERARGKARHCVDTIAELVVSDFRV